MHRQDKLDRLFILQSAKLRTTCSFLFFKCSRRPADFRCEERIFLCKGFPFGDTASDGVDKSVSVGVGAFRYQAHAGIGMRNGFGQLSVGGSHTANRVIAGGDITFKAGGITATAAIATAIIMTEVLVL